MKTIVLTKGKIALIDDEDYEEISRWKWFYHKDAAGTKMPVGNGKIRLYKAMHRLIMHAPPGIQVDHKNKYPWGIDNRKSNLRLCTQVENSRNFRKPKHGKSSKFKGVCWHSKERKYRADIRFGGKKVFLGYFPDEISASKTYDFAAQYLFGPFARPNCQIISEVMKEKIVFRLARVKETMEEHDATASAAI